MIVSRPGGNLIQLTSAFHRRAQDAVDAARVALSILHEPIVDVFVDTGGNKHLRRALKLSKLFVGKGRVSE
jgi:hypothetical protein